MTGKTFGDEIQYSDPGSGNVNWQPVVADPGVYRKLLHYKGLEIKQITKPCDYLANNGIVSQCQMRHSVVV